MTNYNSISPGMVNIRNKTSYDKCWYAKNMEPQMLLVNKGTLQKSLAVSQNVICTNIRLPAIRHPSVSHLPKRSKNNILT
jgi:hypothetical protein